MRVGGVLGVVLLLCLLVAGATAADWDRGVNLYNRGDYQAALSEFHDLLARAPDLAGAWYYVGLCEFNLKRYERVERPLRRAIELMEIQGAPVSEVAGAWRTFGLSLYLQGEYERCVEPLRIHIRIASSPDPAAGITLGRALYFLERFDEALPLLTSAGRSEIEDGGLSAYFAAAIYFKREDDERAIPLLREAIRSNATDPAAFELLAESLMRRARKSNSNAAWAEAADTAEQLVALRPDSSSHAVAGRANLGAGRFHDASLHFEKIVRAEPENGEVRVFHGIALSRSGQKRKAMEALEIAIQLRPDSMPALAELAYVYESDKQYQQALRVYQKAYELTGDESIRESIERVRRLLSEPQ